MASQAAADLRFRAAQARRMAQHISDRQARKELLEMAIALESEAERIETKPTNHVPPPVNGA